MDLKTKLLKIDCGRFKAIINALNIWKTCEKCEHEWKKYVHATGKTRTDSHGAFYEFREYNLCPICGTGKYVGDPWMMPMSSPSLDHLNCRVLKRENGKLVLTKKAEEPK